MKCFAFRALVVLGLATACNDVNEPGEFTAPLVALTFPPPVSSTDAESITVTGTASDPSGVAEVRVSGVLATTSDGFATWQADVPLGLGRNTLTVTASDVLGNSQAAQAGIESQALLRPPIGITVDPSRQVALVLDGGIKAVDLVSGARTTISDSTRGTGPDLRSSGIALAGDRALGINAFPAEVVAVDLVSGDRTILSDDTHGIGPPLHQPLAIAVDGDRALVTDFRSMGDLSAIVAVDLVSGDRTILSGPSVGTGPGLHTPQGIVVDGSRALVLDRRALLAVDLATGDRTILSNEDTGTGPVFGGGRPVGITLDGNRALVTDSGLLAVIAVDLVSGDRTILSDSSTSGGPPFVHPTAIALDETDPTRALVVDRDRGLGIVLAVDLSSGERSLVSPATSVGTGPPVEGRAIALEGNRALLVGNGAFLVAVDLATGERTIVSSSFTGRGPRLQGASAVAVDGDRALVLATPLDVPKAEMALFAIDLASGDRSILSGESRGVGPGLDDVQDIALAGGVAFVTDSSLLAVELASGDRRVVSNRSIGQGPFFAGSLRGIVVDGNRAFVITNTDSESLVFEVDLASGDRRIVSAESKGEGPLPRDWDDMVLDGDRLLVVRSPGATLYTVDVATGDRTILADFMTGAGPSFSPSKIAKSGDRVWVTDLGLQALLAVDPRFGQRVIVAR